MRQNDYLTYELTYIWENLFPWFYTGVIEIETLKKMYDWLFDVLMGEHNITIKNNNPYTADKYGIYIYELIYDIKSDPNEDLETRRKRVIAYMSLQPPYTYRFLQQYLNDLIGTENYKMSINVQGNILTLVLNKDLEHMRGEIVEFIYMIKPASLLLELKLDYNTMFTFWPYRFYELYPYTIFELKSNEYEKKAIDEYGTRYNKTFYDMYWRTFHNISRRQEYKNVSVVDTPVYPNTLPVAGIVGQNTFIDLASRSFNEISKRQEYKNVNINGEE